MATADLSDFQSRLKGLTDAGSVSPPQLSADKATAAYTVTLSVDPASTTAVHAVEGPIRAGAHAAAPAGTYVLAAFVVATFFTPSLTALVGRAAWWPGDSGPRSVATPAAASSEQPQGVTTAKHRRG